MKNAKAIRLIQKLLLRRITRPSAYSDRQSCPDHVLPDNSPDAVSREPSSPNDVVGRNEQQEREDDMKSYQGLEAVIIRVDTMRVNVTSSGLLAVKDDEKILGKSKTLGMGFRSLENVYTSLNIWVFAAKEEPDSPTSASYDKGGTKVMRVSESDGGSDPQGTKPTCKQCGKTFTRPSSVIRHERTHDKKEQVICPDCGKNLSRQDALNRHSKSTACHPDSGS